MPEATGAVIMRDERSEEVTIGAVEVVAAGVALRRKFGDTFDHWTRLSWFSTVIGDRDGREIRRCM